jgi:hypothetical protein
MSTKEGCYRPAKPAAINRGEPPRTGSGVPSANNITINMTILGEKQMKYDRNELENLCAPVIEYLKNYHPYTSVVVTTEYIKIQETQTFIPTNNK